MRIDVAFTPAEAGPAHVAIVVDVMRATSTIAQALASGYRRVLCCGEIDEARALREQLGEEAVIGGEREGVLIEGFDLGASPRDYLEPRAETAILTTTNGTRTTLAAAANAEHVILGSLLNLDTVAAAAREPGEDITVVCAGYKGAFAVDDAYCAGRIVGLLGGERTDAAVASAAIARAYPTAWEGVNARTYGPPGLEDDLRWCTQENTLSVVPRFTRMVGPAAEVTS
ncbi:MAG: 2-phosphosulfolactate phosphatase [Actinobacteria bacterium]|nr:MAG: 2-phosphosulfolactate phosphatase [Actinomycetota bacterium]